MAPVTANHWPPLWRSYLATFLFLLLAGGGLIALSAVATINSQGSLLRWALQPSLSFDRLLPLIGFGLLLAQLSLRARIACAILLIAGTAAGSLAHNAFLSIIAPLRGAGTHFFYAGPLATLAVGLCLILPPRWRMWPALPIAFVTGGLMMILASLSDLTLHDRFFVAESLAVSFWIIALAASLGLILGFSWSGTATRILGSWLLAISLLYGGAFAASKDQDFHPPEFASAPAEDGDYPGFGAVLENLDAGKDRKP